MVLGTTVLGLATRPNKARAKLLHASLGLVGQTVVRVRECHDGRLHLVLLAAAVAAHGGGAIEHLHAAVSLGHHLLQVNLQAHTERAEASLALVEVVGDPSVMELCLSQLGLARPQMGEELNRLVCPLLDIQFPCSLPTPAGGLCVRLAGASLRANVRCGARQGGGSDEP